ncbi:MAG TPA: zinc-binding dehydrogenase [Methylomirabilota bacterium]|nr:zinc-binding dehydrogenase [Methylomirabilota bacterium]
MRIMRRSDSTQSPPLVEADVPRPQPWPGELLVRVYAAGVTSKELLWYPTTHERNGGRRRGAVPGHEFSGVVAAVGDDTTGFDIGQAVYGMNDWFSDGAMAEYCITQPASVAAKPGRLTHVEAASVPIGALTAWQELFERARLHAGERVLVHGAAGAVGIFAVQLARSVGASVTATVSSRNLAFVSRLGAEHVVDYKAGRFEDSVRDMDVVFDTVGGETLQRSWGLLRAGGRMVTIAADSENTTQLTRIGDLLEAGDLEPVVDAVLPLTQASAAYRVADPDVGSWSLPSPHRTSTDADALRVFRVHAGPRSARLTFRILRSIRPDANVFVLSGVLDTERATRLQELLATEADRRIVLDLKDVTLVDRAAVRFLARVEMTGTEIVNCPEYVGSWIAAEDDNRDS